MDTSFIPTCFQNTTDTTPQGLAALRCKETGSGTFLSLLKGTIGKDQAGSGIETASGRTPGLKQSASADALSKSLDVIGALAFLPVLLTRELQAGGAPTAGAGTRPYSEDTINGLLGAITNALKTGNMDDVQKALKGNEGLETLLSGQLSYGANGSSEAGTEGSDVTAAGLAEPSTKGQTKDTVKDPLAAIIAGALKTGNIDDGQKAVTDPGALLALLMSSRTKSGTEGRAATGAASGADPLAQQNPSSKAPITDTAKDLSSATVPASDATIGLLAAVAGASVLPDSQSRTTGAPVDPGSRPYSGSALDDSIKNLLASATTDAAKNESMAAPATSLSSRGPNRSASAEENPANSNAVRSDDDVVRNTMLLGAILPNLLAVKPETKTAETTPVGRDRPSGPGNSVPGVAHHGHECRRRRDAGSEFPFTQRRVSGGSGHSFRAERGQSHGRAFGRLCAS